MDIRKLMKRCNPFPALFDGVERGKYPESEMGYIRAYYRGGMWNNTCFPVGKFDHTLASDINDIYKSFTLVFPTVGKMTDWCRKNLGSPADWCGHEEYRAYIESPAGLYALIMRNAPGDYNLYLHAYDRFRIPWSDKQWIEDRVMENYECLEEVLNSAHFDFNVSLPQKTLLEIYAKVQKEINGDDVVFPDGLEDKYTGNFAKFLLSCNGKEGFGRTNEEIDDLEFIM